MPHLFVALGPEVGHVEAPGPGDSVLPQVLVMAGGLGADVGQAEGPGLGGGVLPPGICPGPRGWVPRLDTPRSPVPETGPPPRYMPSPRGWGTMKSAGVGITEVPETVSAK